MCSPGHPAPPPATAVAAASAVESGLEFLASADMASMPAAEQAGYLRSLERSEALRIEAEAERQSLLREIEALRRQKSEEST